MTAHEKARKRVSAYLERRSNARNMDVEAIHGFDVSPEGGIELRSSDLRALLDRVKALEAGLKCGEIRAANYPEAAFLLFPV